MSESRVLVLPDSESVPVAMPRLGESVTEGTVTRWLKQVGEAVEAGEPLLEVATDKVDTEVESPVSGVLLSIAVGEGETVDVGVTLAVIGQPGNEGAGREPATPESATVDLGTPQTLSVADTAPVETDSTPSEPQVVPTRGMTVEDSRARAYVSPLVRKFAREHAVALEAIIGSGAGGRVSSSDVQAVLERRTEPTVPAAAPQAETTAASAAPVQQVTPPTPVGRSAPTLPGRSEPMSPIRRVIAARMVESLQTSAQLTTVVEVDVTRIARLRELAKGDFTAREGVALSFLPFFAVAAIEALRAHPRLNASVDRQNQAVVHHDAVHLGVAVDTERGLMVPVVRNANDLSLAGIARKVGDLAQRSRAGHLKPDDLGGDTFTLTNTGSRGALFDTPIINQPQVGILGTGAVVRRPVVVTSPHLGETIAIRSMVYLALTYDHRIVDGADAARYLVTVKNRLEEGVFERSLGLA